MPKENSNLPPLQSGQHNLRVRCWHCKLLPDEIDKKSTSCIAGEVFISAPSNDRSMAIEITKRNKKKKKIKTNKKRTNKTE